MKPMLCKKMKNKNCLLYYKTLKSLFPDIGYRDGKFLRDLKTQIQNYSITHPNCTYEELENMFGKAEDVIFDYIESIGSSTVHRLVRKNAFKKKIFISFIIFIILFYSAYLVYLCSLYKEYSNSMINTKESIIYEGKRNP